MHNIHWLCAGANMVRFRLHWRTYALYIDIVGLQCSIYSPALLGNIHNPMSLSVSFILQSFIFKSNIETNKKHLPDRKQSEYSYRLAR